MPARILVVDDEPQFERLILQRFRKQVREGLFDFLFAADGVEALEIIGTDPAIDMVLTDINMPRMDGLTLLEQMKEVRPLLKAVIVSAYGDMPNIRKAMNLGAFDFVTKPIEFSDLEITIQKTLEVAQVIKEAAKAGELAEKNELLVELDQLKTKFFTNISHEFRTPLTVIAGMAEQIGENPERWLDQGLGMIRRNTNDLLDLVQQILDLRKLESGKLELHPVQEDVISFFRYILESLHPLAETRDIQLLDHIQLPELVMDFDPEKLQRILFNLLGNALKFCRAGDQVIFDAALEEGSLQIKIQDTGPGMPPDQLPYIFDQFYQGDGSATSHQPGTGIGLSLVRELTHLMQGRIEVESEPGKGATFSLTLPIRREAPSRPKADQPRTAPSITQVHPVGLAEGGAESELPSLLVVEDNADVARYLMSCLEGRYQLTWARDGQEGIDTAIEAIPDLVVSDVMMPRKDGFELCQTLKTDTRTSHIPIVLLTAKADAESRMAGLKRGADAYLGKPFDKRELLIRLEKLLELRSTLQARYSTLDTLGSSTEEATQQEDEFVLQLKEQIHVHMDEETFGIHELCRATGVSRTQMHRKLKALTGRSASSFIRYIRLLHARHLLQHSSLNISQVAYESGFRDPKYFSTSFSEEFGMAPKDFRNAE
ncbi:MAG: response regulator [Lewinellaceae bacterium]|nr:response regulator [Lewinellaceae bacterium]